MDTNRILMIDPATRKIEVPEKERIIGVYKDHDSERKYFKCPRIVGDNVDLSQHRIYINYVPSKINGTFNEEEEVGSYRCEDVATDGDYVTFSWKISDNVTREAGYIAFAVYAKKADADGNLETKWHTTPAIGNVLDTLPDGDQIVNRYPDIIEQIMERLDRIGEIDPRQIAEAVEEYMTENPFEETDPTVPDWAKQPEKPTYTAEEVGADASGTAESKVSVHNTATDSHNDIRILVQGLTERLNALADSDDTTLDQMSEVVAYIKSNKSLIDAITTSKVSVSDIIDNLTTNVSNKPLSAAQGVALKALIDGITTVGLDETLTDNTKAAPAGMVGELKSNLSTKIDKPSAAPEVGKILKVTAVNDDGTFTCEWADAPIGGIKDVKIPYRDNVIPPPSPEYSEISITDEEGIARIQRLSIKNNGVGVYGLIAVKAGQQSGLSFDKESRWDTGNPGGLILYCATESIINDRFGTYNWGIISIPVNKLDYAVKCAMCDGKGEAWTAEEQKASRERQGAEASMSKIIDLTTSELVSIVEISVDDNNNAFDLQDFELHIYFPSDYSGSQYPVYLYLQSSDTEGIALNNANLKPVVSDSTATNFLKVIGSNGVREYEFIRYYDIAKCHKTMNPSRNRCQFIKMYTYDASTFPIGTRIVLWKRG